MRFQNIVTKKGYVYILSNTNRNVLYIGMTNDLICRIWRHKQGLGSVFTRIYNLKYLVYFESFPHIQDAIDREKRLKNWHREWKLNLIKGKNPTFRDLWPEIIAHYGFSYYSLSDDQTETHRIPFINLEQGSK